MTSSEEILRACLGKPRYQAALAAIRMPFAQLGAVLTAHAWNGDCTQARLPYYLDGSDDMPPSDALLFDRRAPAPCCSLSVASQQQQSSSARRLAADGCSFAEVRAPGAGEPTFSRVGLAREGVNASRRVPRPLTPLVLRPGLPDPLL